MKQTLLTFALMLLPMLANADNAEIGGINYYFDTDEMTAMVVIRTGGYKGAINIPATVEYNRQTYPVTTINVYAFRECTELTSVTIGDKMIKIDDYAFFRCSRLASVTIPNSVVEIGKGAFRFCSSLTSVTVPNSVKSLGIDAFADCTGLTSITIGNSVTSIGAFAFNGCSGLLDLYCLAKNVPTTGTSAFGNSNIANATLHVPAGSVSAYQATAPWSQFGTIVGISEETNGVSLDKTEVVVKKNKTVTLKATVTPETLADKSVKWESSDKTIATVTSSGKVKGVKTGIVTITCTSVATGAKATCKVTVATITLNKSEVIVKKNKTVTLTPTVYPTTLADKSVKWKSSDKTIATVTSSGKVKGVKCGTATITCTSVATGLSATCKVIVGTITLNKSEVTVKKNKTVTLTPTVYPTTLEDKSVTWKSSDETIATVASDGTVKGVKTGIVTITCTSVATGLSTTCQVIVGTITLNKSTATVAVKGSVTLKPTVYPTTLEDKSVTWKSSDTDVATVSKTGKVKGVGEGTATITCTSVATGLSATCKVTVTASSGARTLEEENADVTGIEIVETPAVKEPVDVYDLSGRQVLQRATSLDGLPAGVYIVNGKKVLKK